MLLALSSGSHLFLAIGLSTTHSNFEAPYPTSDHHAPRIHQQLEHMMGQLASDSDMLREQIDHGVADDYHDGRWKQLVDRWAARSQARLEVSPGFPWP
jgi:hypothetical protein